MLGKYKFTDKELKVLLDSLTVIIDTREQENSHVTEYLKSKKRPFKSMKLDFGDYSFMLPANPSLQIPRDIYFNDHIVIERKAKIIELVNNLCEDNGVRLESEFLRSKGAKFYLVIENTTYRQAVAGNYEISPGKISKYKAESLIARINAFEARYGIITQWGIDSVSSGNFIYYKFRLWLREKLKGGDIFDSAGEVPLPNMSES